MEFVLGTYAFLLGGLIGSFLNVVIHRVPREESIVFPPSRCPGCGARIRPWDNVPVISWLLLRGKCRDCRTPITARYPLIELANALFYLAVFVNTGLSWLFPLVAAVVSMLICLIYIDLDIQILPNAIDLPGIGIGLLIGFVALHASVGDLLLAASPLDSLLGALLGYLLLFAVDRLYQMLRGTAGMGEGDMKMLAMLGAVFGWKPVLPVVFIASLAGAVVGVTAALRDRERMQHALPFGVFLGFAALLLLFFGHTLSPWYGSLLGL